MTTGGDGDPATRRLVAGLLGVLGVMLLVDVLVIAIVDPARQLDGFRQGLLIIVGALLIVCGVITFAWPTRGSVETPDDDDRR